MTLLLIVYNIPLMIQLLNLTIFIISVLCVIMTSREDGERRPGKIFHNRPPEYIGM